MKFFHRLHRRLHWLSLPGALLIALLQRTPALRHVVQADRLVVASPVGQVMRGILTAAALGAMHSRAGATQFVINIPSPINGTVGQPIQAISFTYTGTPSSPSSFQVVGTLPPGLAFIPAPDSGVINSGTPFITGTPTQAGSFQISVQGFNSPGASGFTNGVQVQIQFEIGGGANTPPSIAAHPQNQSPDVGSSVNLSVTATGSPTPTFQWQRNGTNIFGASSATLNLSNVQPADAGTYQVVVTNPSGSVTSQAAIVTPVSAAKLVGTGQEFPDIAHPNGNIFDQILAGGAAISIRADNGQAVRISFIDLTNDIVQVEFSGVGTLSLVLDNPSGPAAPTNYNQAAVAYMKGHPTIVITGANQTTNVGVFSVGRSTAFDPTGNYNILQAPSATNVPANNGSSLFAGHTGTQYDGLADVALIAISSSNGQFGGIRAANASFFATKGLTGVYAPGVQFTGPMFISDLSADFDATPVLRIGGGPDTRITGGDLRQANEKPVQVSGLTQLKMTAGGDSHGNGLAAKNNQAQLVDGSGANVTAQIVVNP